MFKKVVILAMMVLVSSEARERISVYEMTYEEATESPSKLAKKIDTQTPLKIYERSSSSRGDKILQKGRTEIRVSKKQSESASLKELLFLVSKYSKTTSLENSRSVSKILEEMARHL